MENACMASMEPFSRPASPNGHAPPQKVITRTLSNGANNIMLFSFFLGGGYFILTILHCLFYLQRENMLPPYLYVQYIHMYWTVSLQVTTTCEK